MSIRKKGIRVLLLVLAVATLCVIPAFASSAGNVADAVEQTWTDAAGQIKTVVNTVVFPALTMVLGIAFFVKVALCFFDYRKHGQFEWTVRSPARAARWTRPPVPPCCGRSPGRTADRRSWPCSGTARPGTSAPTEL